MKPDPVRAIADAVLYEGYVLWPYTRSALKNQRRFTFGGVYPPAHSAEHPDDRCMTQTEVLLQAAADALVEVEIRFLQIVRRTVKRRSGDGLQDVDELTVAGERFVAWEEAVERSVHCPAVSLCTLGEGAVVPIEIAADVQSEELSDGPDACAGLLERSWKELQGEVRLSATPLSDELWLLTARVANLTEFTGDDRQLALVQSFCSTHALLHAPQGAFVSLTDPPADLTEAAGSCQNVGTWPVLVGEYGDRSTILSSPIILEDYPRIAPESPGDLFDGGEIDQLLILNILTLTDEEKAEMAASDPRTREILRRSEALTPEELMALHGTVREFGMVR